MFCKLHLHYIFHLQLTVFDEPDDLGTGLALSYWEGYLKHIVEHLGNIY